MTDKIAKPTLIDSRDVDGRLYKLERVDSGFEPAGAGRRWTDGYYRVRFRLGASYCGSRHATLAKARAAFDAATVKATVTAPVAELTEAGEQYVIPGAEKRAPDDDKPYQPGLFE